MGPRGLAPRLSTLSIALEWRSSDSGWRALSVPVLLKLRGNSLSSEPVDLSLILPANTVRGVGSLSLQLLLSNPGKAQEGEEGLACISGFRFGQLGPSTRIVIDGSGSIFPIVVEALGSDKPLWKFSQDWTDPSEDEFSPVWLSLSLNKDHSDYSLLGEYGNDTWTPLFSQVVTSWLTAFLLELKEEPLVDFEHIASGRSQSSERGSIVDAAATMVRRGNLDCSSPGELFESIQLWVDKSARKARGDK
ncbi:hypothetical protein D3C80_1325930 [compost metagenome]